MGRLFADGAIESVLHLFPLSHRVSHTNGILYSVRQLKKLLEVLYQNGLNKENGRMWKDTFAD